MALQLARRPGRGVSLTATNLAPNPATTTFLGAAFSGVASGTTDLVTSGGPLPGTGYWRRNVTATTSIGANADVLLYSETTWSAGTGATLPGTCPASSGQVFTLSLYVRCSKAVDLRLQAQHLKGAAGAGTAVPDRSAGVVLTPNSWARLALIGSVSPSDTQALRFDLDSNSAITWNAGDTLDVACLMITEGAALLPWTPGRRVA